MAVKFISVKCPECGATMDIEEGRNEAYCTYCGTKILINNDNEYIYRNIDEAGIKRAETDRIVKLKQLEMAEKQREEDEKAKKLKIKIALILGIAGGLLMILGFLLGDMSGNPDSGFYAISMVGLMSVLAAAYIGISFMTKKNDEGRVSPDGKIEIPSTAFNYRQKSYKAIETVLKSAGFTNIQCVPLKDLTKGIFGKPDMVESITINGQIIDSKKYSPDVSIVILYHSFSAK